VAYLAWRTSTGRWFGSHPTIMAGALQRLRNTLSVGGVVATSGISLAGSKVEGYVCPGCGGPVRPRQATAQTSWVALIALTASGAIWLLVALATVLVLVFALPYRLTARRREPMPLELAMRSRLGTVGGWVGAAAKRLDPPKGPTGT